MIKQGKKTIAWSKIRAELKKEFEEKGITYCEVGYDGCTRNNFLSFSHGDKRRYLTDDELRNLVVVACIPCHQWLEALPRTELRAITNRIIRRRMSYN